MNLNVWFAVLSVLLLANFINDLAQWVALNEHVSFHLRSF